MYPPCVEPVWAKAQWSGRIHQPQPVHQTFAGRNYVVCSFVPCKFDYKTVRQQLGIQPGDRAVGRAEDGRLVVYFVPKPHRESLLGALRRPGQQSISNWHELKETAWRQRSAEIMETLGKE